jgi:hypothetical protein
VVKQLLPIILLDFCFDGGQTQFNWFFFILPLQHRENSMSFKTMDDGQVLIYAVSTCQMVSKSECSSVLLLPCLKEIQVLISIALSKS